MTYAAAARLKAGGQPPTQLWH